MANEESVILAVSTLHLVCTPTHDECAYDEVKTAKVTVSLHGETIAAVPAVDSVVFPMQLAPKDLVYVTVDPGNPNLHVLHGIFRYEGQGRLVRQSGEAFPSDFAPAASFLAEVDPVLAPFPDLLRAVPKLVFLTAYTATIKNVSPTVRETLRERGRTETFLAMDIHAVDDPPVESPGGELRFVKKRHDPVARMRAFERAGNRVPKMVVGSFPHSEPKSFAPFDPAESFSFLYFIHPTLGQNVGYYAPASYPYAFEYAYDAGLKYIGYFGLNTLVDGDDNKGLAYQVAAGGKRMAVVLPVHKVGHAPEHGDFAKAEDVAQFCHEMHAWFARTNEVYIAPPPLGPSAIGAFSSGNMYASMFLAQNKGRFFCDETLTEVWSMDPPSATGAMQGICATADLWLKRGATPEKKRFRLYSQEASAGPFLGFRRSANEPIPKAPFVLPLDANENDKKTLVVTTPKSLQDAANKADVTPWRANWSYWEAHAFIPALMVVDAARRSAMPAHINASPPEPPGPPPPHPVPEPHPVIA